MADIAALVEGLQNRAPEAAYACFLRLKEISGTSALVYPYFDRFAEMMESGSSYVRVRGLLLIAANARWDTDHKIDEIIDSYLTHVMDAKPTVSRQLIAVLPELAVYKPDLADDIRRALQKAVPGRYRDSMAPLIERDIAKALERMEAISPDQG